MEDIGILHAFIEAYCLVHTDTDINTSRPSLEDQLMRVLSLGQTPRRLKVFAQVVDLLYSMNDLVVDLLLGLGFFLRMGFFGLGLAL